MTPRDDVMKENGQGNSVKLDLSLDGFLMEKSRWLWATCVV